jgi:prepilin-type N-terminal cleavage/methylation domain-containing protein
MWSRRRGFTLIELLVVIAILTLLLSILVTSLSHIRKVAAQTREMAGGAQLTAAYLSYSNDNRDLVMPAYLKYDWAYPGSDPAHEFSVWDDLSGAGMRLEGDAILSYPWRLAPYLAYDTRALILDKELWGRIRGLSSDDGNYQLGVARNPSFGMNGTYVGGDAERGGFQEAALRLHGRFYVTKTSEPTFPNRLLIFSTARGPSQADGQTAHGWYRVDAPVVLNADGSSREYWMIPYWDPDGMPGAYGWLDLRHSDKGVATHFDGHCELLTSRDFHDMRRWSNQADRANWEP